MTTLNNFGDFLKDYEPSLEYADYDTMRSIEINEFAKGNAVYQNADTDYKLVIVPIEVGMPATYGCGSDSYSAEVVAIEYFKSGNRAGQIKTIKVKGGHDFGYSEFHPYIFGKGDEQHLRLQPAKNKYWAQLVLGYARDHRDLSF